MQTNRDKHVREAQQKENYSLDIQAK